MRPRLHYLGQSGLILEAGPTRLACDPWFFGALFGPRKPQASTPIMRASATHVYISCSREHRRDALFLKDLSPDTTILAPAFGDGEMQRLLEDFENVVYLGHQQELALPGMHLRLLQDTTTGNNGSALLIELPDFTLLNLNSCLIHPRHMPECDMLWASLPEPLPASEAHPDAPGPHSYEGVLERVKSSHCSFFVPSSEPPMATSTGGHDRDAPDSCSWDHFRRRFAQDAPEVIALVLFPGDTCTPRQGDWRVTPHRDVEASLAEYRQVSNVVPPELIAT